MRSQNGLVTVLQNRGKGRLSLTIGEPEASTSCCGVNLAGVWRGWVGLAGVWSWRCRVRAQGGGAGRRGARPTRGRRFEIEED